MFNFNLFFQSQKSHLTQIFPCCLPIQNSFSSFTHRNPKLDKRFCKLQSWTNYLKFDLNYGDVGLTVCNDSYCA